MKSRKVVLTLEIETPAKLSTLKKASNYYIEVGGFEIEVVQAEANVIKDEA